MLFRNAMNNFDLSTRFEVIRKIADGGMGSIFEARQHGVEGFSKTVAIKTLLPKFSDSERLTTMFIKEAKLVSDLVHENIVQVYQLSKAEHGYLYIMEYVHGLSLHEFIDFHREDILEIPQEVAVFIASRIARGLSYAHSRMDLQGRALGIVHRDVSPKNIMITSEGLPKLTDFGLAFVGASEEEGGKQSLVGKFPYMAPEQAQRETVDHRADIYSLGAVLFELLALEPIRKASSREEYLALSQSGAVRWGKLPESVDPEIRHILERCLDPVKTNRYEKTEDLAWDLEYFIYRDGYGPTIQTLEEYLRQHFAVLYRSPKS